MTDAKAGSTVRVLAHGGLLSPDAGHSRHGTLSADRGTTLAEALQSLGIDPGIVGVATQHGKLVQLNDVLRDEGVIHVYPLFGGG